MGKYVFSRHRRELPSQGGYNQMADNNRQTKQNERIDKRSAKKLKKMKKKADKKPMNKFLKWSLITVFGVIVACGLTACIIGMRMVGYVFEVRDGESLIDLEMYKSEQYQTSILYAFDDEGEKSEIARLHGTENREWVSIKKIPENLQNAFICLEDKRFLEHEGVDWLRTAKGFLTSGSSTMQGGSTLTQQLIKNLTKQNQATFVRKFNEILNALNLEKNYEKKDILEAYLNTIYLGSGCYGVKTAAETYFGKSLKELTVAECAMLASITQNPYKYNPYTNFSGDKGVEGRMQYCLSCMFNQGKITEKQYNKALKYKIKLTGRRSVAQTTVEETGKEKKYNSYYVDYVIDEIISDLRKEYGYDYSEAWRQVYCGGLKIETAVDMRVQGIVEDIYLNRTNFPYSRLDKYGKYPESAITIMDYQGRIVAIVGGTGKKTGDRVKNRAATSFRQPGSSIKPLTVYGPCVDKGYIRSGNATVLNEAITLPDGTLWPRNYAGDKGNGEYITVESALCRSLNTVPARLLNEVLGVAASYEYATEKFHLEHLTPSDKDLSPLCVGGTNGGVSTLEMASAYAVFGNGGRYYESYSYYRVLDRKGKVLLDNTKPKYEQAMNEGSSRIMLDLLSHVTTRSYGTAYGCTVPGMVTFAKTGTTTDNNDKWMCIGSPYYVMSIWYGYDMPSDLSSVNLISLTKTVLSRIHEGLSTRRTFSTVRQELN